MPCDDGKPIRALARATAVLAAAGLVVLWALMAWRATAGAAVPAAPTPTGPPAFLALGIFASLAGAGGAAALRGAPLVTVIAALVSLVPVGLWLLLAPGPGRWIGALDLALLGAGVVLLRVPEGGGGPAGAPGQDGEGRAGGASAQGP